MDAHPKIFFSYNHTTAEYMTEIRALADMLVRNGMDVYLDQYDLKPGSDIRAYTESAIRDASIDRVLLLCDRGYRKAAKEGGGDSPVLTAEQYSAAGSMCIAVAMDRDGDGAPCFPSFVDSDFCIEYTAYDGFDRLVRVENEGGVSEYSYRPDGLRHAKTVDGKTLTGIWEGTNLGMEIPADGSAARQYYYGVGLIQGGSGGTGQYYLHNGHGDVVQMADYGGMVTKTYEYDAFGNERDAVETDWNPFRYCGEYLDKETGDIYLRARYYSPSIGRFTQVDPHWNVGNMIYGDDPLQLNKYTYAPDFHAIAQSGNLYGYGMNNPVRYVDPSEESLTATWGGTTYPLMGIDGPLPVGDTIFVVGVGICLIIDGVIYFSKSDSSSPAKSSGDIEKPDEKSHLVRSPVKNQNRLIIRGMIRVNPLAQTGNGVAPQIKVVGITQRQVKHCALISTILSQ